MDLQFATHPATAMHAAMAMRGSALAAHDVTLRPLAAPQIPSILHLRHEIDLSVHAAAGPQFDVLEKKETSTASPSRSNSAAR